MSLSSAKAKLDAQGGDPATGYISKTDHKDSYDQLVADTALTGATTAEAVAVSGTTDASSATTGTLKTAGGLGVAKKAYVGTDLAVGGALTVGTTVNGRDPDDLAKGAASSTDNALVRFDGTDGKTVQNSGITVDDSGYITSDLTISKANPAVQMNATSGAADFYLDTTAGNAASIRFRTGTSLRWIVSKDSSAESSTATGSDLYVSGYNNSGSLIGSYLQVQRSTGRFTIYNTGAGAGLRLGSGGPEVMSGTGSPESVVTAPVGSTWTDTAATTGAIQWIKASGTGNTGWVVQYGDTGVRNVAASATAPTGGAVEALTLRRVGSVVSLVGKMYTTSYNTAHTVYTLPAGFRNPSEMYMSAGRTEAVAAFPQSSVVLTGSYVLKFDSTTGNSENFVITWITSDAWPASLPGSAV